jgi:hypothetical protein
MQIKASQVIRSVLHPDAYIPFQIFLMQNTLFLAFLAKLIKSFVGNRREG